MLVIVNQKKETRERKKVREGAREKETHRDREEMLIKLRTVPIWS